MELKMNEASIDWTLCQLAQLASDIGLKFEEVRTQLVNIKDTMLLGAFYEKQTLHAYNK